MSYIKRNALNLVGIGIVLNFIGVAFELIIIVFIAFAMTIMALIGAIAEYLSVKQ